MPIAFRCSCGRALNVKDALAGKKIRCPACQSILAVPDKEIEADDLALEVLPADEEPVRRSASRNAIQVEPPEVLPARRRYDEDDDDDPPIKRRPKRSRDIKRRGPSVSFEQGWFGSVNAGVVGGLLMMLIAVVWFVAGLMGGIIFFYPPILFVVGIIAIVKGGLNN